MEVSNKLLKNISFLYIIIPVMLFIIGWVRYYIAIPVYLVCGIILYNYLKGNQKDKGSFLVSKKVLLFAIILAAIFIFFSGIGELVYQPDFFLDYKARNAIFKSLIYSSWPVRYADNSYLCYYICQWIVPAVIGKGLTYIISNSNLVLLISNIILYLWCVFGMLLLFLWVLKIFKKSSPKKLYMILISFAFFSGLDILGELIVNGKLDPRGLSNGFEWWSRIEWQYPSFNSFIYWAFNQAFISLLITLITVDSIDYKNQLVWLVLGMFYSPFQMLSIGVYCLTLCILNSIKNKNLNMFKKYIKLPNILAICFILPVISLYYLANYQSSVDLRHDIRAPFNLKIYIIFVFVEFLIYVLLIYRKNYKYNKNILIITFYLLLIPLIGGVNLILKFPMPFLVILWVYIMKFLLAKDTSKLRKVILIVLLSIAAINPFIEIKGRVYNTFKQGHLGSQVQRVDMLDIDQYFRNQYLSIEPEKTIFFRYLVKGLII